MLSSTCGKDAGNAVEKSQHRGKILIVEDEEDMVRLLDYRLRNEQYLTMIATNGHRACELVESFRPDCVLLDIMLPEMDGWQVCEFIRNHPDHRLSSTPIVMLTALGDQEAKIRGLELGADGYIAKPYAIKEVLLSCARLIGESRNRLMLQSEIDRLHRENRSSVDLQSLLCHELKNHLAFIHGFYLRLKKTTDGLLSESGEKYLDLIGRSAAYLLNITEEVLLIRQVETGDIDLANSQFELRDSLEEVLRLYDQAAAKKNISIRSRFPHRKTVALNRGAFKLIFSSLLENAVKYGSPDTKILCSVTVAPSDSALILKVIDQGQGIAAEEVEKVFEKYYRGRNFREFTRGTGVGLYAVKMLSESLGGWVTLQSVEGKGSSFTVYLPLSDSGSNPA